MQNPASRRRFIAGAVCPRCALMDKIVVDLDTDQRCCISCGFSEARPGMPEAKRAEPHAPAPAELPTRVSRAAARRVETPAEAITLVDKPRTPDKPDA
jgi:uncharacterized metal-binding protein (TIGR02443 family)